MINNITNTTVYDYNLEEAEQLPRRFSVIFRELESSGLPQVQVKIDGTSQVGDIIDDNSYEDDGYRYHDIFHYTFATLLGWSPCSRAMMKRKRKSDPIIDKVEDGARATITEEAVSLMVFNEAKRKSFFKGAKASVSKRTLKTIKLMTSTFEVRDKTTEEWERAILKAYEMFRLLISNKGGVISFNMLECTVKYTPLPQYN